MGRELKRVPLNFNAPRGTIWKGYINPYSDSCKPCPFCEGSGSSPEAKRLNDMWYGNAPFRPEDNGSTPYKWDSPPVYAFAVKNVLMSELSDLPGREGFEQGCTAYWAMYKEGTVDAYVAAHPELDWSIEREGRRLAGLFNPHWSHHLNEADVKALLDDGRLIDFTRRPLNKEQKAEFDAVEQFNKEERERRIAANWKGKKNWQPWKTFNNGYVPTPQEVNDWGIGGMGHDACNMWVCVKARMKREKLGSSQCAHCKGHGTLWLTPAHEKRYENWKRKEPPKGTGFQLWKTTNEGEPFSPVFKTLEALCEWCEVNATTFADYTATKEEWMKMLDNNFVSHKMVHPSGETIVLM